MEGGHTWEKRHLSGEMGRIGSAHVNLPPGGMFLSPVAPDPAMLKNHVGGQRTTILEHKYIKPALCAGKEHHNLPGHGF